MHIRRLLTGTLPITLLLGACALSPQVVRIQPGIAASATPAAAADKSLALKVVDARPDRVIGVRGGVYDTATITTADDMTSAIRQELARVYSAAGYRVVGEGDPAAMQLEVRVSRLSYQVTRNPVTRVIETAATLNATSSSGSITRTGEYSDKRTKEMVGVPTERDNADLVNEIISATLQQLVQDQDLLKFREGPR